MDRFLKKKNVEKPASQSTVSEQNDLPIRKSQRIKQNNIQSYFQKTSKSPDQQSKPNSKNKKKQIPQLQVIQKTLPKTIEINLQSTLNKIQKSLFGFRNIIIKELDQPLIELSQSVVDFTLAQKAKYWVEDNSQIPYESLVRLVKFLFYKTIIPHSCSNWDQLYEPDLPEDFLDDRNSKFLKYWLKMSFKHLKTKNTMTQREDSNDFDESYPISTSQSENHMIFQLQNDPQTQSWHYYMLKLYGEPGDGKVSLIKSIARNQDIEVIVTNEFTERRVFEELFQSKKINTNQSFKKPLQSQNDELNINEEQSRKKLVLHRMGLPKYFDKIQRDQRIPFVWIIDSLIVEDKKCEYFQAYDIYNYQKNSNLETTLLVFLILVINQNFYDKFCQLRFKIRDTVTKTKLEQIQQDQTFFKSLDIDINQEIQQIQESIELYTTITFKEIFELTLSMQGNIRQLLTWIQFYHQETKIKLQTLIYKQISLYSTPMSSAYQLNNIPNPLKLPVFQENDVIEEDSLQEYIKQIMQSQDADFLQSSSPTIRNIICKNIVDDRFRIYKKYIRKYQLNSNTSSLYSEMLLYEQLAVEYFQRPSQMRTRRNIQERISQIDIHNILNKDIIPDLTDYHLFIYYSKLRELMQKSSKLRKNKFEENSL